MISLCESCQNRAIIKSDLKIIFLCPECPDFENVDFKETDKLNEDDIETVMDASNCSRGEAVHALQKHKSVYLAIREVRGFSTYKY